MKAIRAAFFVLVAANLVLFILARGLLGSSGGGEAERLENQLQPEKLRIVARSESPAVPATASASVAPVAAAEGARATCRAVSGLTQDQAQKLVDLLRGRDAQLKIDQRLVAMPSSWWVHLPPQTDRAQAVQLAADVKAMGITDFFIVEEAGPHRYAISLGLYKSGAAANTRMEALKKKGLRSAQVEVRQADKPVVDVGGSAERVDKALADLPSGFGAPNIAECAAKP